MSWVYFKTDTSGPVPIDFTGDGRIDFAGLGDEFGFTPASIKLNGARFVSEGLKSERKWEQIKERLELQRKWERIEKGFKDELHVGVGTQGDPVKVTGVSTGQSAGGTMNIDKLLKESAAQFDKLLKESAAESAAEFDKLLKESAAEFDKLLKESAANSAAANSAAAAAAANSAAANSAAAATLENSAAANSAAAAANSAAAAAAAAAANVAAVVKELKSPLKSVKESINLLFSLHFNPVKAPASTVSSSGKEYRKKALDAYEIEQDASHMHCMAMGSLGGQVPMKSIKASHIFQKQWPALFMAHLSIDINDPANLLLLHSAVEKRLDRFDITIIPEDSDCYRIRVLNPSILDQTVHGHEGASIVYWRQLQDRRLEWTSSHRPAKRLCAFHAKMASLHALHYGWIKEGDVVIPEAAWGSPGFDKKWLLDRFLDDQVGTSDGDSPLQPESLMESFGLLAQFPSAPSTSTS